MAIRNALIAVDFDGTVVTHAYPEIGDDAGAVPVLKELTDNGCRLILYTMRHGKLLDPALRREREPLAAALDILAESPRRPLHRRQQPRLPDPVRGRCETPRSGLDAHPGAVGQGRFPGLSRRGSRPNRRQIRLSEAGAANDTPQTISKKADETISKRADENIRPFAYAMPQPAIMPRGCGDICPQRSSSRSRPPARVCPPCR